MRVEQQGLVINGAALAKEAFAPTPFSSSATVTGELVFVGYGIHAPELGYDDYDALDVQGKIVVAMRFEPQERDKESVFNGERPSRYSDLRRKAFEAKSRGAKAILIRPAPVPDYNGRRRSFALPEFDPFWKAVEEADVLVGMHSSDSGFQRYVNEYEGWDDEFLPFKATPSGFSALVHADSRTITDVMSSIVGHGLATRFPKLRILPVENGSAWVRPLVRKFQKVYERSPSIFDEDPLEAFRRCVWVHPFHEEDTVGLAELIGVDNVVFGSDYPHPEGMYDPLTFVDELDSLSVADQAKIMGGNLAKILKVAA